MDIGKQTDYVVLKPGETISDFRDRIAQRQAEAIETRRRELAEQTSAVETTVLVDIEDHLLSVGDEQHLFAIDLVGHANLLLHHGQSDRVTGPEFHLFHDKTIAHAAAFRSVCTAEG